MTIVEDISDIILNAGDTKLNVSKIRLLRDIKTLSAGRRAIILDDFFKGFGLETVNQKWLFDVKKNGNYEVMVSDENYKLLDSSVAVICFVKHATESGTELLAGFYIKESESNYSFYLWDTSTKCLSFDYDVKVLYDCIPTIYKCSNITKPIDFDNFMNPPEESNHNSSSKDVSMDKYDIINPSDWLDIEVDDILSEVDKIIINTLKRDYSFLTLANCPRKDEIAKFVHDVRNLVINVPDKTVKIDTDIFSTAFGINKLGKQKMAVSTLDDTLVIISNKFLAFENSCVIRLILIQCQFELFIGINLFDNGKSTYMLWNVSNRCPVSFDPIEIEINSMEDKVQDFVKFSRKFIDDRLNVNKPKSALDTMTEMAKVDSHDEVSKISSPLYSNIELVEDSMYERLMEMVWSERKFPSMQVIREITDNMRNGESFTKEFWIGFLGETFIDVTNKARMYISVSAIEISGFRLLVSNMFGIGYKAARFIIAASIDKRLDDIIHFGVEYTDDIRSNKFKYQYVDNRKKWVQVYDGHITKLYSELRTMAEIAQESNRSNNKSSSSNAINAIDDVLYKKLNPLQSENYEKLMNMTLGAERFPSMCEIVKIANKIQNDDLSMFEGIRDLLYPYGIVLYFEDLKANFIDVTIQEFRLIISKVYAYNNKAARFIIAVNKNKSLKDVVHFGVEYIPDVDGINFKYVYIDNFNKGLQEYCGHITYLYENISKNGNRSYPDNSQATNDKEHEYYIFNKLHDLSLNRWKDGEAELCETTDRIQNSDDTGIKEAIISFFKTAYNIDCIMSDLDGLRMIEGKDSIVTVSKLFSNGRGEYVRFVFAIDNNSLNKFNDFGIETSGKVTDYTYISAEYPIPRLVRDRSCFDFYHIKE